MSFEWVLTTPKTRDFVERSVGVHEMDVADGVDAAGAPVTKRIRQELVDEKVVRREAGIARLASAHNDPQSGTFMVRFVFGRLKDDGSFDPAQRDDGILIGGPNYVELNLDPDGSIDEPDLLKMCAQILKWDGSMRALAGGAAVASTPTSPV